MTLSFDQYQAGATETAVYPDQGTGSQMALAYVALGLGEAGEVQGKIKKILRGDPQARGEEYRLQVAKEMGDILWYIAQMATELGYSLGEVAQMNLDKLAHRAEAGTLKGAGDER